MLVKIIVFSLHIEFTVYLYTYMYMNIFIFTISHINITKIYIIHNICIESFKILNIPTIDSEN